MLNLRRTCLAQHVYVDPGRHKVGQPTSHDHNAFTLEEGVGVGRGALLKGVQLSLCTLDSIPATTQCACCCCWQPHIAHAAAAAAVRNHTLHMLLLSAYLTYVVMETTKLDIGSV